MINKMKTCKSIYYTIIDFYRNLSLNRKLLLLFYIQIIIPIIIIGYASYDKSSSAIKNKSFQYSQDILRMIELRIESFCSDIDSLSLQFLYDNKIYEFLKNYKSNNLVDQYNNATYIRALFRDAVLTKEGIESICLVTSGSEYIYFDSDNSSTSIKKKLPYNYIYEQALAYRGETSWILYKRDEKNNDIYGARVIYNREDFKPIGLLVILLKKDFIESLYRDLSPESVNNIILLSSNNQSIIENKLNSEEFSNVINKVGNKDRDYFVDKETNSLLSYVYLKKTKWKIVYYIPLKSLYKDIDELRMNILFIVILSILSLSIISRLTAYDIVQPINKLVEAMKKLESNGIHKEVAIKRNDEIGYLANSFNTMSYNIDNLVNMNYKEKLTRKEAQLKALQSQINPHFIFNTLENINWQAQLNGVNEISNTVTALAKLMEASIGKGSKLISLEEELTYIDSYIEIFKNRFPDKLTVNKNLQPETLHIAIPKLLIEPIVENSLNHGIERVTRYGELSINSFIHNNTLVIEVCDNGIGIEETEVEKLMEYINSNEEDAFNNSIGLMNVNKRIKLFYGEDYGLNIESKYDTFTKVTVTIPIT